MSLTVLTAWVLPSVPVSLYDDMREFRLTCIVALSGMKAAEEALKAYPIRKAQDLY